MKVCHVTSSHQRYDGRIFQKECISLAQKYNVTLICADNNKDEIKENVRIISLKVKNKNKIMRFFIIPKKLKKICIIENADIYHFHDPELISLALYMKKKGKKVIFDSHEDNVNRIANRSWLPNFLKPIVKYFYEKKEKKVLQKVDAIITVTDHIYNRLKKINKNTFIITNYPIVDNHDTSNLKNNNILCFAGGVSKQYMHHNIIKAIEELDVRYKVAGPFFEKYNEEIKDIPGYDKVDFLGKISKEEVNELYLESGIGMVLIDYTPNIDYKNGSKGITKIYEYMAYGLPVIATDLKVWLDFVPNNCGLCVNPNNIEEIKNAIIYIIDHPKEARKMGRNGRKLVEEKYNWKTQETKLLDVYNNLESSLYEKK